MKLQKIYFTCLIIMFIYSGSQAQDVKQDEESQAVMQLIVKLFDGMREGDSTKVSSVFGSDVSMYTSYTNKDGVEMIKKGELQPFLEAIGTPHEKVWDERIWNTEIHVEGGIAQVWTDYAFYVDADFSHCGVDAFHLIKDKIKGWQIVHLMDTRRKENCEAFKN